MANHKLQNPRSVKLVPPSKSSVVCKKHGVELHTSVLAFTHCKHMSAPQLRVTSCTFCSLQCCCAGANFNQHLQLRPLVCCVHLRDASLSPRPQMLSQSHRCFCSVSKPHICCWQSFAHVPTICLRKLHASKLFSIDVLGTQLESNACLNLLCLPNLDKLLLFCGHRKPATF